MNDMEPVAWQDSQMPNRVLYYFSKEQLAGYLERCLSKLAEQAGEPVAWKDTCLTIDEMEQHHTEPELLGYPGWEALPDGTNLFTESQLIAAQQKAAEACGTVAYKQAIIRFGYSARADDVRDATINDCRGIPVNNDLWLERAAYIDSMEKEVDALRQQLANMTERHAVRKELSLHLSGQLSDLQEQLHAQQICHEHVIAEKDAAIELVKEAHASAALMTGLQGRFDKDQDRISTQSELIVYKDAQIERLKAENRDACIGLNDYFGQQLAAANADRDAIAEQLSQSEIGKRRVSEELEEANAEIAWLKVDTVREVAEAKAERDAAYKIAEHYRGDRDAIQAREQQLREALENHSGNYKLTKSEAEAINAVVLRSELSDTSALEALIAKAGEVMREAVIEHLEERDLAGTAHELRALPGVTLEDLK